MNKNHLVNRDAKFDVNELCTIAAALERSIDHGIKGIKTEVEGEKREYIVSMYLKHITLHVTAYNALCINKDGTEVNYLDDLKFNEAAVAKVQEMIDAASNDQLSQQEGHVYQLWQDGETTSQKAGELLWQRSLHQMDAGLEGVKLNLKWPHQTHSGNGYIFCTELDAKKIRIAMLNLFIQALCY